MAISVNLHFRHRYIEKIPLAIKLYINSVLFVLAAVLSFRSDKASTAWDQALVFPINRGLVLIFNEDFIFRDGGDFRPFVPLTW